MQRRLVLFHRAGLLAFFVAGNVTAVWFRLTELVDAEPNELRLSALISWDQFFAVDATRMSRHIHVGLENPERSALRRSLLYGSGPR
jgi:hypothetical protein